MRNDDGPRTLTAATAIDTPQRRRTEGRIDRIANGWHERTMSSDCEMIAE
jgi:hypothetical protein